VNTIRTAVRVEGVVQGVGFRPFVYALATGLGLTGLVGNDLDGVFAEVEGPQAAVAEFLRRLERDAPPLARIERVTTTAITPTHRVLGMSTPIASTAKRRKPSHPASSSSATDNRSLPGNPRPRKRCGRRTYSKSPSQADMPCTTCCMPTPLSWQQKIPTKAQR